MLSAFLLILGCAVISFALRGSGSSLGMRLGNLGILMTSYLVGWQATGMHSIGALCAASWILLPWIDILTRVRRMRMPSDRPLRPQAAPGSSRFPALQDLTEEIEREGFEHAQDVGWDHDEQRQFVRLFIHSSEHIRATINLVETEELSFYYLTLATRCPEGRLWLTWNYPFSSTLKPAPSWRMQRLRNAHHFGELLQAHRLWLRKAGQPMDSLPGASPEALTAEMEQDLHLQMAHNLACGLLLKVDAEHVKYSWRGCFFLWTQFLRDLLRA